MDERLLELLNTYTKSSYELDNNITLDSIKERIQLLHAWDINQTPSSLFRYTDERLVELRESITDGEIEAMELTPEEAEGLTEEEIIEKKKDKILANKVQSITFWNSSTQRLINYFQEQFMPLINEDDPNNEEELKYSKNMKIIKNRHRIKVNDLNDNFQLISEGITKILKDVLSDEKGIYKNFFKYVLADLMPLWENVLYLWIMYVLKNSVFSVKPLIKYVYLNENDFFPSKHFDFSDRNNSNISLAAIGNKLRKYVHEYQNCNLIIVPIIRLDNYEDGHYSKEAYPGIFYHPAILNNKLFKPNEKFIVYPFTTITNDHDDNFVDGQYITVSTNRIISKNELYLGKQIYGYTINGDDLYYAAPFDTINIIREIYPKKYYSAIRTKLTMVAEQNNSYLILKNFQIQCYDAIRENLINDYCETGSISWRDNFEISLGIPMDLLKDENVVIAKDNSGNNIYLPCKFNYGVEVEKNLHKISNFRIRLGKDENLDIKSLKLFQNECISGYQFSKEEDYSYLIEYIPFESAAEREDLILEENLSSQRINNYVGDINTSGSLGYKDNDLLHKHFVWDNKRNNILEDKFVLRIGQHLEKETLVDSNKADLVRDYLKEKNRPYFDYDLNEEIEEIDATENYYNSGTVEIGAYLNIPFIEDKNERITYYPEFLSHIYASDYIVPTQVVEYKDDVPDYFANRKLYRDYTVNKDYYFQIYTTNGDEDFSDDWSIKMIEVISQQTPTEEYYFNQDHCPPYKETKTMEELYNYWKDIPSDVLTIDFKKILPFFSQLCPTQSESAPKKLLLDEYRVALRYEVKQAYGNIVDFFFNGLSDSEKQEVYDEITDSLFFNYRDDNIYPMAFTRSRSINSSAGAPPGYVYDYSLSMVYGISQSEINANAISDGRINKSHWNGTGTFTSETVKKENFDLIYQSPEEYRGYYYEGDGHYYKAYLRTDYLDSTDYSDWIAKWQGYGWGVRKIELDSNKKYFELLYGGTNQPWADGIYPIIPSSGRLDVTLSQHSEFNGQIYYPLCKQAYKVERGEIALINVSNEPIVKTNFPQTQIVTSDYNDEILDETYLLDYWINGLLNYDGSQYIYSGFSSVSSFDITLHGEGQDEPYGTPKNIDFKTMIFGANIPLIKQDEPFDTNVPRGSQIKGDGWTHNDNMYGTVDDNGEMLGVLIRQPVKRQPQGGESQYVVGPWGTLSFKEINLGMNVIEYWQMSEAWDPGVNEDIEYTSGPIASFSGGAGTSIDPFLNMYYIPHLNYNKVQIRQYPHIFLYSQKTLFPSSNLFNNKTKNNKTSYKIYNENKYIASLREFYKLLPNRQASKIPYPFPKTSTGIYIEFKNDKIKPSFSEALAQVFDKNFITNYDYSISLGDYVNYGANSRVQTNYPHFPFYLDYFDKNMYLSIRDTFKSENFPVRTAQFKYHKASPIDIFEGRYLYHNKYYGTNTSVDNIANRPLFYGHMANLKNYFKTVSAQVDTLMTREDLTEVQKNREQRTIASKYFGTTNFMMSLKSIYEAGENPSSSPNRLTAYTNDNDSLLNIDSPLSYEKENQVINNMNLQIIVHWFGPNGKYARKVMTRNTTGTPLPQDHFILGDYNFKYREWTNNWTTSYYNSSNFASFEADLANQSLFKQSATLVINGQILNFETYPNNGIDK